MQVCPDAIQDISAWFILMCLIGPGFVCSHLDTGAVTSEHQALWCAHRRANPAQREDARAWKEGGLSRALSCNYEKREGSLSSEAESSRCEFPFLNEQPLQREHVFKVKFNSISLWQTDHLKPNLKPGFSWFQPVAAFPSPLWCFLSQQLDGNVIRCRVNSCELHLCDFGLVSRLRRSFKTALTRNSSETRACFPYVPRPQPSA